MTLAIDNLLVHAKKRRYAMRTQQMLDMRLLSFVRLNYTGWRKTAPEAERKRHNDEAKALIAAARKGEGDAILRGMVTSNELARAAYDNMREEAEGHMTALAAQLPVADWVKEVRGAGLLGLATIVGEAGALDKYANPAKLWSRLGFAPYEGAALSTYRRATWRPRALTSEEWEDHPFKAERYAYMAMLAEMLHRAQWIGAKKTPDGKGKPKGPYGQLYADRRAHCELTHPDWTDMHRKRDALRVMFKRFLADLWEAWIDAALVSGHSTHDAQEAGAGGGSGSYAHLKAREETGSEASAGA